MAVRPYIRILVFALSASMSALQMIWLTIALPRILQTHFGFEERQVAVASALFFSCQLMGLIVGCLVWPIINRYLQKRVSIILGLVLIALFNSLMGLLSSFYFLCFVIFLVGTCTNSNSVGKDFIFEFVIDPIHRQYALTVKSIFNILALFGSPYLVYSLYSHYGHNFNKVLYVISGIILFTAVVFFLVFFLDYNLENQLRLDNSQDEEDGLAEKQAQESHKSMFTVFRECYSKDYLRVMMNTYMISNALTKSANVIIIIFAETSWKQHGLGITAKTISIISLCSIIPAFTILLQAPLFVPKKVHYFTFIQIMIFLTGVTIVSTPLFRDLFTEDTINNKLVYFIMSFIFWANPKSYSPFLNFLINSEIRKQDRTSLNASLFFVEIVGAMIAMQIFAFLYRFMIYSELAWKLGVFAKYTTFSLMVAILAFVFFSLGKQNFKPVRVSSLVL